MKKITKITLLLLTFGLFTQLGFAQDESDTTAVEEATEESVAEEVKEKKYQGLLWEISGNGMEAPSYLYGTMHVSKKVAFHLSDTFFMALNQADVVGLEISPDSWMKDLMESKYSQYYANGIVNSSYYSYSTVSSKFYENLTGLSIPENEDFERVLKREHSLQNSFLYRSNDSNEDFEENTYLDLFIFQAAKKKKKPVVSLESYDETMELIEKANEPDPETDDKKKKKKKSYSYYRSSGSTLEDYYRDGDLDMIDSLTSESSPSNKYLKYFLHERNRIMAEGMDSMIKAKQKIFIGVGAAHLPGDNGVIELMRAMGYKMRPVSNMATKMARKEKNKSEDYLLPLKSNAGVSSDGFISYQAPGDLFETRSYYRSHHRQSFYPEMINGGYYHVTRIFHYSPLTGKSKEEMLKSIDSLLFENIPGKILKQKDLKSDHYVGFDITNKTRKGDYQRYHIYVTPLETIIVKMGGTGKWVKGSAGKTFFNSLKLNWHESPEWVKYAHGKYSIEMPGQVFSNNHGESFDKSFSGKNLQSIDPKTGDYFLYLQDQTMEYTYIEEDTFEVKQLAVAFVNQFDDWEMVSQNFIDGTDQKQALSIAKNDKGEEVYIKTALDGTDYFALITTAKDQATRDKYFGSLKRFQPELKHEVKTYVDSALAFSVRGNFKSVEYKKKKETSSYSWLYGGSDDEKDYESKREYKSFLEFATKDKVLLKYVKYDDYFYYENIDSFWIAVEEDYFKDYALEVKSKELTKEKGLDVAYFNAVDTNSTKVIKSKFILKSGALYSLFYNYDEAVGTSPFSDTIFNSFALLEDSVRGRSIFEDKKKLFYSDLRSSDTLDVERALELMWDLDFEESDADSIIHYIELANFKTDEVTDNQKQLIWLLSRTENDKVAVPYLAKKYKSVQDTAILQFAILQELAQFETKRAYTTLPKLLVENPPFMADNSQLESLYEFMRDSLKLTSGIINDLFELNTYPEYKDENYYLLSVLVDSSEVDKSVIEKHKRLILRDASADLKRLNSEDEEDDDSYYSSSSSDLLVSKLNMYNRILVPLYDDKDVKKHFDNMMKSSSKDAKYYTSLILTKHNHAVNDTMWNYFASDKDYKYALYVELKELDQLSKIDTVFKDQMAMNESILMAEGVDEKDSIVFMGKYFIESKTDTGYVYFYKTKEEDSDDWSLSYIGLLPKDTTVIQETADFIKVEKRIYTGEKAEELVDEYVEKFKLLGRKRAVSRSTLEAYDSSNYWY